MGVPPDHPKHQTILVLKPTVTWGFSISSNLTIGHHEIRMKSKAKWWVFHIYPALP